MKPLADRVQIINIKGEKTDSGIYVGDVRAVVQCTAEIAALPDHPDASWLNVGDIISILFRGIMDGGEMQFVRVVDILGVVEPGTEVKTTFDKTSAVSKGI